SGPGVSGGARTPAAPVASAASRSRSAGYSAVVAASACPLVTEPARFARGECMPDLHGGHLTTGCFLPLTVHHRSVVAAACPYLDRSAPHASLLVYLSSRFERQ